MTRSYAVGCVSRPGCRPRGGRGAAVILRTLEWTGNTRCTGRTPIFALARAKIEGVTVHVKTQSYSVSCRPLHYSATPDSADAAHTAAATTYVYLPVCFSSPSSTVERLVPRSSRKMDVRHCGRTGRCPTGPQRRFDRLQTGACVCVCV